MRYAIALLLAGCGCEVDDAGIVAEILARSDEGRRVLLEDDRRVNVDSVDWDLVSVGDCVVLNDCYDGWGLADEENDKGDRWACDAVRD